MSNVLQLTISIVVLLLYRQFIIFQTEKQREKDKAAKDKDSKDASRFSQPAPSLTLGGCCAG